jgi:Tol biopolymer transport system component/uncharacterized caspase-like protein
MSRKLALIIGNSEYEDENLAQLVTPGPDASILAAVLRNPEIGGFDDVAALINQPAATIRRAVSKFFVGRKRDDLLLLYFSGHGIRNDRGKLFLAVKDTEHNLLSGTAIPAAFITDEMDNSHSRRQVLILDCCHSGAFSHGTKAATGTSAGTATAFEGTGSGRVVLTATDSTQYAWEGDRVIGQAENSVFTHFLIQGLRTGEADTDADGRITLDELYEYVYEHVIHETPKQTPSKWSYGQQGELVIAKNPRPVVKSAELPPELQQTINDPRPWVREGAVRELERLLRGNQPALAIASQEALKRLSEDDSRRVATAATDILTAQEITHNAVEEALATETESPEVDRDVKKDDGELTRQRADKREFHQETASARGDKGEQAGLTHEGPGTHTRSFRKLIDATPRWAMIVVLIFAGGLILRLVTIIDRNPAGIISSTTATVTSSPTTAISAAAPPAQPTTTLPVLVSTTSTAPPAVSSIEPTEANRQQIAFNTWRDGNWEIYVMNGNGSDQTRLTNNSDGDFSPAWSPDGTRIVFVSDRDGYEQIYVMDAGGSNQTRLTNGNANNREPDWSLSGSYISYVSDRDGNLEIYVMNADGSNQTRLTNIDFDDKAPAWSPDGTSIAFASNRDGNYEIYVMNADGSNQTRLTNSPDGDFSPAWSPDGTRIVFTSYQNGYEQIFLMNADGSNQTQLTSRSYNFFDPSWSPDGMSIVYSSDQNGNEDIFVMNADGSDQTRLTFKVQADRAPAWQP